MKNKVQLDKWNYDGDRVRLVYPDGDEVFVTKKDFDRAFGCIVCADKSEVERDFAIN